MSGAVRARVSISMLGVLGVLSPATAQAEPFEVDKATAQVLFEEGHTLMEKGDIAAACARFERSQKLDASGGTLLNLALCHERLGRVATAWIEFHDALGAAMRDARKDREAFAREHIDELTPRLPRVLIRGEACTGCEVRLDGRVLDRAALGVATPVDPGEHRLVVRARSDRESVANTATLGEGQIVTMDLPAAPADVASVSTPASAPPRSRARWNVGLVSVTAGAVALGVGSYFGARALSLGSEADATCPASTCADRNAVELSRQAETSAWIANISLGTAVVAGGIGMYLLLTSRPRSSAAQNAMLGRVSF